MKLKTQNSKLKTGSLWIDKDGNLNKRNLKILLIIVFFLLTTLLFSFNKFTSERVGAQGSFGYACKENYAQCGNGQVNLLDALNKNKLSLNTSEFGMSDVIAGLKEAWGPVKACPPDYFMGINGVCSPNDPKKIAVPPSPQEDLSRSLCISSQITELISYNHDIPKNNKYEDIVNIVKGGVATYITSARACAPGTKAMRHELGSSGSGGNYVSWGCCLPNQVFLQMDQSDSARTANFHSACCPPGSIKFNGTKCLDFANTQSNPIDNGVDKPRLGIALGYDNPQRTNGAVPLGTMKGSLLTCDDAGCAATGNFNSTNMSTSDFTNIIDSSRLNSEQNLKCTKCYSEGSVIGATSTNLVRCIDSKPDASQELINGNITDTLAYLATDLENREDLKNCRERGGIYIAIGCIDTTPTGIITGLIRIAFGIMGGVALFQLILAGVYYQIGDEAKIKEARDRVVATLTGIAVLVFSILILRIIGINVLDILPPGSI